MFGWGTYNRNRIYDPETGQDLSVTDGDWIIQVGTRGIVGFLGLYGMLALSIVLAQRRLRAIRRQRDRIQLAALALISALRPSTCSRTGSSTICRSSSRARWPD